MQHPQLQHDVSATMMTCDILYEAGLRFLIARCSECSMSVAMKFLDFPRTELGGCDPLFRSFKLRLDDTITSGKHTTFYTAVESVL